MSRYLGQHFLINKDKIKKIVEALDLKEGDTVIEIGPGHGELTLLLARNFQFPISNFRIITIEKDKKLVQILQKKFASDKNIRIIEGDALKILPKLTKSYKLKAKSYKIVGNIPYYITGYLLRVLAELERKPSLIVLTIQKEVAQRIIALRQAQGKPRMNLLAASVQFWAEPEIIDYVSRKDFQPAPEVDSAVIKMVVRPALPYREVPVLKTSKNYSKNYYRLIKILFKQPRKTILNNILEADKRGSMRIIEADKRGFLSKKLHKIGVSPSDRPENLSIKQIRELSTLF
ncbi:MAG: ribosomal RNA small subunit methyltransferase A [Parcubacteria group bacterium CG2_30_36_18]|nr:MAG: ribosomal RNA small subunit methyltransferase A [Parcubacteria group bacterium CG2_30_36_18]